MAVAENADNRYHHVAREDRIVKHASSAFDRMLNALGERHPIAPGEERIDPRTARRRLRQVPHEELFEHLTGQG